MESKSYTVKSVTLLKDLGLSGAIRLSGKKVAKFVPNLFSKIKSGYKKMLGDIVPTKEQIEEQVSVRLDKTEKALDDKITTMTANYDAYTSQEKYDQDLADAYANKAMSLYDKLEALRESPRVYARRKRPLLIPTAFFAVLVKNTKSKIDKMRNNKKVEELNKKISAESSELADLYAEIRKREANLVNFKNELYHLTNEEPVHNMTK